MMLYTIIDFNDIFYKNQMNYSKPRSTNPYDYIRTGYYLDNAQFFGGQNNVSFNSDFPSTVSGDMPNFTDK